MADRSGKSGATRRDGAGTSGSKPPAGKAPAGAARASRPPQDGPERRTPLLREQCETGLELLRDLLGRAGYDHLVAQISGLHEVDEILLQQPGMVPLLMTAAWELRAEKKFRVLFLHAADGSLVASHDDPIAPCGRTYAQILQAHLYGAARLNCHLRETEWARKRATEARRAWERQEKDKRKSMTGKLMGGLRDLTSEEPDFSLSRFRPQYPGYGLYDLLKPHLRHTWQFPLIPLYARMTTRQADVLGDRLSYFTTARELEMVLALRPEDIGQARAFARVFAESKYGLSRRSSSRPGQRSPEEAQEEAALAASVQAEEKRVFEELITSRLDCLEPLKGAGASAEGVIRRLARIFGDELWALFLDQQALANAINCPDFLIDTLGPTARAVPPEVAKAFTHMQDPLLIRDILEMAMQHFPRPDLEALLSDPSRLPIWKGLPAKFNNVYRYQADAPADSPTLRNYENLTMVCDGLFDALRTGRVDKFEP